MCISVINTVVLETPFRDLTGMSDNLKLFQAIFQKSLEKSSLSFNSFWMHGVSSPNNFEDMRCI